MLPRDIFTSDHDLFRDTARKFFEREIQPSHREWEKAGVAPRSAWLKAGETGMLCVNIAEAYGGAGADRLYSAILIEEQARLGLSGPGFSTHSDIVAPYILNHGNEAQKQRWLPRMARGEAIGAIVMTEPGAGSDLKAIRTTAVRDGEHYIVNGQKTFITNGQCADLLVTVVKTDPTAGRKGISLLVIEGDTPGLSRGKNFDKVGMKAQDTCELFFNDMRIPVANRLGPEGEGFRMLVQELAWERLQIAIGGVATAAAALDWTIAYTRDRTAFGKKVAEFQNTRFKLAELKTQVQIAQVFVDRCLELTTRNALDPATAAMAKYWCTELQFRACDEGMQLHGGYGYIWDFPIARAFADSRVHRIYGGSNEIMKEIIARTM
jgi:alkylation response protein AidB-like acyl-CoA dehydrogenase